MRAKIICKTFCSRPTTAATATANIAHPEHIASCRLGFSFFVRFLFVFFLHSWYRFFFSSFCCGSICVYAFLHFMLHVSFVSDGFLQVNSAFNQFSERNESILFSSPEMLYRRIATRKRCKNKNICETTAAAATKPTNKRCSTRTMGNNIIARRANVRFITCTTHTHTHQKGKKINWREKQFNMNQESGFT